MSVSVRVWLFLCTWLAPPTRSRSHEGDLNQEAIAQPPLQVATQSPQRKVHQTPNSREFPTTRANPFPKVSDLFCRLPLSTLNLVTRGCIPWRPDAVVGTTLGVMFCGSGAWIFTGYCGWFGCSHFGKGDHFWCVSRVSLLEAIPLVKYLFKTVHDV